MAVSTNTVWTGLPLAIQLPCTHWLWVGGQYLSHIVLVHWWKWHIFRIYSRQSRVYNARLRWGKTRQRASMALYRALKTGLVFFWLKKKAETLETERRDGAKRRPDSGSPWLGCIRTHCLDQNVPYFLHYLIYELVWWGLCSVHLYYLPHLGVLLDHWWPVSLETRYVTLCWVPPQFLN